MSGEPRITKTHRWPPELVDRVEALAREAGVSRQAVWDRCVELGLRERPFVTSYYNRYPVWSVVVEFPRRPHGLQTTQIHGPYSQEQAWEEAERLARQYGVPVQARDILMETCVWVCAMRPAPMDEEVETVTRQNDEVWQAWLGDMLMGDGPTREAAIEAAVREYESVGGYGEYPLLPSREELLRRLDVGPRTGEA